MSEGFAAIPNWMIRDERFTLHEILVYTALASHSGPGGIFAGQATLCREARLSESSVRRALRKLEAREVIVVLPRSSRGGRLSNAYELRPNGPTQQPVTETVSGVQPVSDDVATGQEAQAVPLIEQEPIKNASEYFDEFWSVYPRHVAKAAAKAKFEQLGKKRGSDLALIVEGARRYAASGDLPEPKFIPHPMTWLNQRRWEDELPAAAPATLADAIRPSQDDWLAARGVTLEEYTANYQKAGWLEQLERDYMRRLDE